MHTSPQQPHSPDDQQVRGDHDTTRTQGPGAAPLSASRRGTGPLWALGGALLATLVFGAVFLWAGDHAGPAQGYRMSDNLCSDAKLANLGRLYDRAEGATHGEYRHRALDVAECLGSLTDKGPEADESLSMTLRILLHKTTDPRPEFAANGEAAETNTAPVTAKKPVQGLGERAYFGVIRFHGENVLILKALDGGAEFDLSLVTDTARTPEELKSLMIKDIRALMKTLSADGDRKH
ncbi:hypothetical protein [Streptomyces sp. NPDC060188]|uniref:hypothetical protein n=1 Tax=Streptomyces sp. NPDC060188 TaxID=3347068 RepID=UPI00366455D6